MGTASLLERSLQSFRTSLRDHGGDEGRSARDAGGELTKKIAETTQLKTKDVNGVLAALQTIACAEVKKTEKFVIPQLTTLKLKHKPARKAGKKMMFGKEVKVAAKPASKVVKAFPAKALKDSI